MIYRFNQCVLDTDAYRLTRDGREVAVEPLVFDLLVYLVEHRERVVGRDELLDQLWSGKVVTDAALAARLKDARKAAGDSGARQAVIKTFHGRGYQFVAGIESPDIRPGNAGEASPESPGVARKPRIAVLPFTNMSGNAEQDYFTDGIVEDIITELSHFRDLSVTARNSSFGFRGTDVDIGEVRRELEVDYLLEGSIRKSGNRVRVSAQLIDTTSGSHVWADRYDRDLEDIFAVQDEVVHTIAATLFGRVQHADHERARRKPTTSLQAYDCVVLGLEHFYRWTPADNRRARELFEQAIAIDPEYATAYAWLAEAHFREGLNAWSASWERSFELLFELAQKAVSLDENDSRTHTALGVAYLFRHEHSRAQAQFERALALNPSDTHAMVHLARCVALQGDTAHGLDLLAQALRFNPLARYQWFAGQIHYISGQYAQAARELGTLSSPNVMVHAFLAASHGQMGNRDEAQAEAALFVDKARQLVEDSGAATPENWCEFVTARFPFKRPEDARRLRAGLEIAGLG